MKSNPPYYNETFELPDGKTFPETTDTEESPRENFDSYLRLERLRSSLQAGAEATDFCTSPDTSGCDYFFVTTFFTDKMSQDFPVIARDFLLHEYPRLKEYSGDYFAEDSFHDAAPDEALERKLLSLILSAARKDNSYARQLLLTLYKLYYKKEYRQLKRFKTLSTEETVALTVSDSDALPLCSDLARILTAAWLLQIRLLSDCSALFSYLNMNAECMREELQSERDFPDIPENLFSECKVRIEELTENLYPNPASRKYRSMRDAEEIASTIFRYFGYPKEYADLCERYPESSSDIFSRTLMLLKISFPGRDFSFDEIQTFSVLFSCISGLCYQFDELNDRIDRMLWMMDEDFFNIQSLFRPDKPDEADFTPTCRQAVVKPKSPSRSASAASGSVPVRPEAKDESLEKVPLPEDELKKQLRNLEQKNAHLRFLYTERCRRLEEAERTLEQHRNEHEELVALREHVYQSTEDNVPVPEERLTDMEKQIAEKRIIIIGGHDNWTYKLKNRFPLWSFLSPRTSGSVDDRLLRHAEHVYFFTDCIEHSTYLRFIRIVREKHIPFGYIHTINIKANIRQIYEDLFD